MNYDPLSEVVDEALIIDADVLEELQAFRREEKLVDVPGSDTEDEKKRLSKVLNDLAARLLAGVEQRPSKLWVPRRNLSDFRLKWRFNIPLFADVANRCNWAGATLIRSSGIEDAIRFVVTIFRTTIGRNRG